MHHKIIQPLFALLLICLSTFSMANTEKASIYTIDSLMEVKPFIEADTLVVFDLDHTIFEGAQGSYGHGLWFYDVLAQGRAQGYTDEAIFEKLYPHWLHSQEISSVKFIEASTPALLDELQTQQIPVMAATSRQKPSAKATLRQLAQLNIHFKTAPALSKEPSNHFKNPIYQQDGVIFAHDFNKKGEVLKAYLDENQHTFKTIILLEDSFGNITNTIHAFKDSPTKVIGLYYTKVADQKKDSWHETKAKKEFLKVALQTSHLETNLFFADPELISLRLNRLNHYFSDSKTHPFKQFNMHFVALADVYAPDIFNEESFEYPKHLLQGDILEIGAGTGSLAVFAAKQGAKVVALDLDPKAVDNTRLNAKNHLVTSSVEAHVSDLFEALSSTQTFDLIHFDIPQIHTEDKNPSPKRA